jgi:SAM-dependent methyltransferase
VRGLLDAIRERVADSGRVIELGFGGGWLLDALVDEGLGVQLHGLDLSPGMAGGAHKRLGKDVRIVLGDMERLPFVDHAFDVVVTCWTLYFMRDIDTALAEIKRCLTPRGRLVVGASARDHEVECGDLVSEAIREALGRDEPEHDVGRRFDYESGEPYLRRHFGRVELREWNGEMVLDDPDDVEELWPKWEPALLGAAEQRAVRGEFLRLARAQLKREGALRIRRRHGGFVCDLSGQ